MQRNGPGVKETAMPRKGQGKPNSKNSFTSLETSAGQADLKPSKAA